MKGILALSFVIFPWMSCLYLCVVFRHIDLTSFVDLVGWVLCKISWCSRLCFYLSWVVAHCILSRYICEFMVKNGGSVEFAIVCGMNCGMYRVEKASGSWCAG